MYLGNQSINAVPAVGTVHSRDTVVDRRGELSRRAWASEDLEVAGEALRLKDVCISELQPQRIRFSSQ